MSKTALITGITGQDGSYLSELLLEKNYIVHGIKRRSSSLNTKRIDHLYDKYKNTGKFFLHYGDMTDSLSLTKLIASISPDEIYNLAAQSHVAVSFTAPEYTANVDALGTLRILDAIKFLSLEKKVKFYQASTSELYGDVLEIPQSEKTPFNPQSPYAIAKLYAYWIVKNYRESYGIYACNGILFNHESPRRGETFVTRKITQGLAQVFYGYETQIKLGNIDSYRDWGHAKDYVEMQWLMLQQSKPKDYVIATNSQISVREFFIRCCKVLNITIEFEGSGISEIARVTSTNKESKIKVGQVILSIDKNYFRPLEVNSLLGDASLAKKELGWEPKITIDELIKEMITADLADLKNG